MNCKICTEITRNVPVTPAVKGNRHRATQNQHRSTAGRTAQAILEALDREDEALESEPEFGDFFWRGDDGEGRE